MVLRLRFQGKILYKYRVKSIQVRRSAAKSRMVRTFSFPGNNHPISALAVSKSAVVISSTNSSKVV